MSGHGNNPIFQLKTNFGGGKTHSLLALYHLAGGTKATELNGVSEILRDINLPKNINRAVFVGTDINPLNMSIGGFKINTIWGRIFYEIGGETALI